MIEARMPEEPTAKERQKEQMLALDIERLKREVEQLGAQFVDVGDAARLWDRLIAEFEVQIGRTRERLIALLPSAATEKERTRATETVDELIDDLKTTLQDGKAEFLRKYPAAKQEKKKG
jgi:hypothetical protein